MNQSYLIFIVPERNTETRMYIYEKPILEISFVTLTKNSSVIKMTLKYLGNIHTT